MTNGHESGIGMEMLTRDRAIQAGLDPDFVDQISEWGQFKEGPGVGSFNISLRVAPNESVIVCIDAKQRSIGAYREVLHGDSTHRVEDLEPVPVILHSLHIEDVRPSSSNGGVVTQGAFQEALVARLTTGRGDVAITRSGTIRWLSVGK